MYQEAKQAWRTIHSLDKDCASALKVELLAYRDACKEALTSAPEPCAVLASEIFNKVAVLSATHMVIQQVKHTPMDAPLLQVIDGAEQLVQDCMHSQGAKAKQVVEQVERLYAAFFVDVPPTFVELLP